MRPSACTSVIRSLVLDTPCYAHIGVTHRCNLRCRMCSVTSDERDELSPAGLAAAAKVLKQTGVRLLSLGGGEPFIRSDLPEIVERLDGLGFTMQVLTNGTGVSGAAADSVMRARGLAGVSVSLHSLDPATMTRIGIGADSLRQVRAGFEAVVDAAARHGKRVLINTVVSPLNLSEMPRLAEYAATRKCLISFVPIESEGRPEFAFDERHHRELDEVYARIVRMKTTGIAPVLNSAAFLRRSLDYLKGLRTQGGCRAGRRFYSVGPDGRVSACHLLPPEGSLLDRGILERIRSRRFIEDSAAAAAACTACLRPCWWEVSLLNVSVKRIAEEAGARMRAAGRALSRTGGAGQSG